MSDLVPTNHGLLKKVDELLAEISESQWQTGKKIVQLGNTLLTIRESKAYLPEFKNFGQYMASISAKIERGRTQLYGYVGVAERLLPKMAEEELEKIPVSKAMELARAVKNSGNVRPSRALIRKAQDPEIPIDQFRVLVAEEYHIKSTEEKGKWFDLGGFYVSEEERKEILKAFAMAEGMTEVDANAPDWQKRKAAILAMARECISSWGAGNADDDPDEEEREWEIV